MKKLWVFLVPFCFMGCTTYSQNECLNFNWYDQGFRSAMDGNTSTETIQYFQKECGMEHNVSVNQEKFQLGYKRGLDLFCSAEGGRSLGQSGRRYKGTCPKTQEEPFLKSYDSGRLDFLVSKVNDLESTISTLRRELSSKETIINNLEMELTSLRTRSCP